MRRGGYEFPHPDTGEVMTFPRVTSVADSIKNTWLLNQWELRAVAAGMGRRSDLVELAATLDLDAEEDRRDLQDVAHAAKLSAGVEYGANRGTALHKVTARMDRGRPIPSAVNDRTLRDAAAYGEAMPACGYTIVPELIERTVWVPGIGRTAADRGNGIVGTFDRILLPVDPATGDPLGPPSTNKIGDFKSQKTLTYGQLEIAIQLALYSRAVCMWDWDAQTWTEMPAVDQEIGIVMFTPVGSGRCEIHRVRIDKGWRYAECAMVAKQAQRDKDLFELIEVYEAPRRDWLSEIAACTTPRAVRLLAKEALAADELSEAIRDAGRAKVAELKTETQNDHAEAIV
jgi:hypothetical protein